MLGALAPEARSRFEFALNYPTIPKPQALIPAWCLRTASAYALCHEHGNVHPVCLFVCFIQSSYAQTYRPYELSLNAISTSILSLVAFDSNVPKSGLVRV